MRALLVGPILLVALAQPAAATPKLGWQVELGQSVAIPMADSDYRRYADPSYAGSVRAALLIALPHSLHVGPFLELGGVAVNTDDATFENAGFDARYGRLRFLGGPQLTLRLAERFDVWVRFGFGVDYAAGSVRTKLGNFLVTDASSTSFAFAPELGTSIRVWRMLTVGLAVGFPVAVSHSFAGGNKFIAADAQLTFLFGVRL
jgi:hypothetical protein